VEGWEGWEEPTHEPSATAEGCVGLGAPDQFMMVSKGAKIMENLIELEEWEICDRAGARWVKWAAIGSSDPEFSG
jgi:hypothetical protein